VSARRRIITLLLAALVLAVMALLGRRVTLDEDIAVLLPDTSPELRRSASVLRDVFERTIIVVGAPEGRAVDPEALGAAADRLAERLRASGEVARVRSRMEAGGALPVISLLRERAPRFIDAEGLRRVEERTRPAAVEAALPALARRLQEPDGAAFASSAAEDPLGITNLALAPLGALLTGFGSARIIDGRVTSEDGRHVLVVVEPGFPPTEARRSERLMALIDEIARDLAADPGVQVRCMGAHRATLDNARQIQRDVELTSSIGVALMAAMVILTFTRLDLALLSLLPTMFGAVFALGAFSLWRDSVPAMVGGFGAVLLGLTIDYAIQVLYRFDSSPEGRFDVPLMPLLASGGIMCVACLSLNASSLPGVRDIGTFGALGIGGAVAFAVLVLPALAFRRSGRRAPLLDLAVPVRWMHARRTTGKAVVAFLVVTPLAAVGAARLRFDGDVTRLSSLTPAARADEEAIARAFGEAFKLSSVVVEGATLEETLRANDRVAALLDRAAAAKAIRGHASVSGLLPALETQEARLQGWRAFWTDERAQSLRGALAQAVARTPFRPAAFEPFLAWLQATHAPVRIDDLEGDLGALVRERVSRSGERWVVSTPVSTESYAQVEALRATLAREEPGALLVNKEALIRRFAAMVGDDMALLGIGGFLITGLLVLVWFGRLELALIIMLPLGLSCLWMLGILGWLGVPITLPSSVVAGLLFGTSVEYSIFIMSSRLEHFRTGRDGEVPADIAVILCDLSTVFGFGALALAGHPVLFSIGVTALVGDITAMVTALLFVPPLARAVLKRPGVNGTPRLRAMYTGLWIFVVMVGGALRYALLTRWRLRPEERLAVASREIRDMAIRIRDHLPIGRRSYVGLESAHLARPAILVANHVSMYDIMAILVLPIPIRILVKAWVWRMPVMGFMARDAGYILTEDRPADEVFERARDAIAQGASVLVFPEGRRSRDETTIARFHNGAFAIARGVGVKVIPIALVGMRDVVRYGTWWAGDHDARISVLDPLDPADFEGEGGDRRMAWEARDRIRKEIRRLLPETQSSPGWHLPLAGAYRYLGTVVSHYAASKLKRDPIIFALPEVCAGDDEVLVAGCGYGLMTLRLAVSFPERRIRAIDRDAEKLEVARAALGELPGVSFHEGDLREIDLGAPGTVTLVDVLHYWPPEVQRAVLLRIAAALRPGGRLLFRDGCAAGAGQRLVQAAESMAHAIGFTKSGGEFHFRTLEAWRALLCECGFVVEAERPDLGLLSNVTLLCRKAPLGAAVETAAPAMAAAGEGKGQGGERGTVDR